MKKLLTPSLLSIFIALGTTLLADEPSNKDEAKKEEPAKEEAAPATSDTDEERQDMLDRVDDLRSQLNELREAKLDEEQELPPPVKAVAEKILSLRKTQIPVLEEMISACEKGNKTAVISAERKRDLIEKNIWIAEREREAAELSAEIDSTLKNIPDSPELKSLKEEAKGVCEAYVSSARKQVEIEQEREKLEAKISRIWKLMELAVQKERVKQMEKELKNGEKQ
ncbi:MAG: hypothetical protein A2X49_07995 [Lentisphaerae bacterium GWF2_52_8]|nr:MAG: hypothetical protein A2X49_07995 [Lentisphaerae bacterium GWF2_52_8]